MVLDNIWHFVTFTVDRSSQFLSVYGDGKFISRVSISSIGSMANANSLYIGKRVDNWGIFNGVLDSISFYSRSLTASKSLPTSQPVTSSFKQERVVMSVLMMGRVW